MQNLLNIMAMLRDKKYGCPWDLEQDHASLVRYTLEEVYEVVDAIEHGTIDELKDELGDLLFQVVFYAQIAEEDGKFGFTDVVDAISDKLVRRHPHVFPKGKVQNFGQDQLLSADDVVVNWEAIKEQERKLKGLSESSVKQDSAEASVLSDIPISMPALERALKIQKRAARVGFDWDSLAPVIAKLKEELLEVEEAVAANDANAIAEEIGDLLFAIVNVSRHADVEPESALRNANLKFEKRFGYVESQIKSENRTIADSTLHEMEEYWEQAKQKGL